MRRSFNTTGAAALALLGLLASGCRSAGPDEGAAAAPPAAAQSQREPPAALPAAEASATTDAESRQEETMSNKDPLSALVWMRSEHSDQGATLDTPAASGADSKAARHFRSLGFAVTEPQYGQFSIEGPPELFEEALGMEAGKAPASGDLELDKSRLPAEIERTVHVITFSEPPAFGPPDY